MTPRAASRLQTDALLDGLDARYAALRSFRALAELRYVDSRERVQVREAIVVERPDRLRIEMISPFGVALQITSDGRALRAYHRAERTYYRGDATPANLARFTRLPLGIREIADLLLGLPPHQTRSDGAETAFERPTKLWRVTSPIPGGGLQILWFDSVELLPVRSEEVDRDGNRRYLTALSDYRPVEDFLLPHHIEVQIPAEGATITILYSDVSLNQTIPVGLFSFEAPPGSKIVDLDDPAASSLPVRAVASLKP